MSAVNENHEPVQLDDLHDRLLDTALAELIGQRVPPDLSGRIATVHEAARATRPEVVATGRRSHPFRWFSAAVAAMLLVGVASLLWQDTGNPNLSASRSGVVEAAKQSTQADRRILSSEFRSETKTKGAADFDSLIDLAQSTVQRDVWEGQEPSSGPAPANLSLSVSQSQSVAEQAPGNAPAVAALPSPYYMTDNVQFKQQQVASKDIEHYYESIDLSGRYGVANPTPGLATATTNHTTNGNLAAAADRPYLKQRGPEGGGQGGSQNLGLERQKTISNLRESLAYHDGREDVLREINRPVVVTDPEVQAQLRKTVEGIGPGSSGDKYTAIVENPFIKTVGPDAVSTFSIDVDTASYTNVRQFLTKMNQLPPPDAVRIEELVNYFQYDYTPPKGDDEAPFAAHVEVVSCPWNSEHRLARIAVKGREMDRSKRPQSNLVFLVDVSGSMNEPAKLPLVVYGLEQLTKELGENDHIAIVVYASSEGLVLPSTSGTKQDTILAALAKLQAGGSTAGGAGIQLAYQIAEDNFIKGGTNRVILCTDGDFNVGVTSTGELQRLVEKKAKDTGVFLSVLGFGRGNLNDAMMEAISNHGNGNYHYVDNRTEARKVLVEEMAGTLVTIAKDVKIQVEFNPAQVAGYRLIGYEDRMLRTEDFNNDKKDAGEIGAGHTVTAMYEIIPAGKKVDVAPVDDLKYQKPVAPTAEGSAEPRPQPPAADVSQELLTLKMRYKAPDGDTSKKLEWPVTDGGKAFGEATDDFQFASAVAGFGLLLRDSQYKGTLTYAADLELAQSGVGTDEHGYRAEFLDMVRKAKKLKGE